MRYLSLALGIIIQLPIHGALGQAILFPEDGPLDHQRVDENKFTSTTSTTRSPTTSDPIKCPANMTLTQEPDETEGFCECLIGNLYHPELDRCFLQYTRGPCNDDEHFILRPNATVAKCVRNNCAANAVMYKGLCHELYVTGGPCNPDETLTVPDKSHEPECVPVTTVNYQVITAPLKACSPGSRRNARGTCRKILR